MLKKILLLSTFLIFIITTFSCEDGLSIEERYSSRNYNWSYDSIGVTVNDGFYTCSLTEIWGSSPDNIWLVGYNNEKTLPIWHYDGKTIKNEKIGASDFGAVHGLSKNNVWFGVGNMLESFWHFDGGDYNPYSTAYLNNSQKPIIQSIGGFDNESLIAVGHVEAEGNKQGKGVILKYSASKWYFCETPTLPISFLTIAYNYSNEKCYLSAWDPKDYETGYRIYEFSDEGLKSIHQGDKETYCTEINGKPFMSIGHKIYTYEDTLKEYLDLSEYNFNTRFWGRTSEDIFFATREGIVHYNGLNLKLIFENIEDNFIADAVLFKEKIFFVFANYRASTKNNFIVKGKLK